MTDSQFAAIMAMLFFIAANIDRRGPSRLAWYLAFLLALACMVIFYRAEKQLERWTIPCQPESCMAG